MMKEYTILTSCNVEVQDLNKLLLNKFPGNSKTYDAADSIQLEEGVNVMGMLLKCTNLST